MGPQPETRTKVAGVNGTLYCMHLNLYAYTFFFFFFKRGKLEQLQSPKEQQKEVYGGERGLEGGTDLNSKSCPVLAPQVVHQDKTSKRNIYAQLGLQAQT